MEHYVEAFKKYGRCLKKFKGFYGIGYYHTDIKDYENGMVDWKWAGSSLRDLDDTLYLLREQSMS